MPVFSCCLWLNANRKAVPESKKSVRRVTVLSHYERYMHVLTPKSEELELSLQSDGVVDYLGRREIIWANGII